ncbi:hemerythrin-like domain-containing protein [Actimicrobium sp. GrIS 1.19]|uniref:hemerythrin domain-containing protein n=1 Tax=Actimicrobium sp. GrIS 1.19 TaxID=3071708 RepID=UPI002E03DD69|nr:hemerythrin-like domain-containing protein [Actimicrobium sp. GrIS 1.19]
MDALFDTAPDFTIPIAVLKHCHDRIRKQLATLDRLPAHLAAHGADAQARGAAAAVLRYFDTAAPHHHQDEEQDLLPMLRATARDDDAIALAALLPELLDEHQRMDGLWQQLRTGLEAVVAGDAERIATDTIAPFSAMYQQHMEKEESTIAPMAKRLFSAAQMTRLGDAMQQRRGITPTVRNQHVDR